MPGGRVCAAADEAAAQTSSSSMTSFHVSIRTRIESSPQQMGGASEHASAATSNYLPGNSRDDFR
jgi:hypothetical protein